MECKRHWEMSVLSGKKSSGQVSGEEGGLQGLGKKEDLVDGGVNEGLSPRGCPLCVFTALSSLEGTCSEGSVGPVVSPALSEWKWDWRLQSCPWEVLSFSNSFHRVFGSICSGHSRSFK